MDDITLTFNSNPFIKAISAITSSLASVKSKMDSTFQGDGTKKATSIFGKLKEKIGGVFNSKNIEPMAKGLAKVAGEVSGVDSKFQLVGMTAKGLTMALGKIGLLIGGFKAMLSYLPEVGQTFKIAGDIFMRNFLNPLRRMLLPYLQKLLHWVRENRTMFVRWGTVVANVFRGIFNIVGMLWKMVKSLWDRLAKGLEQVFGKASQSITDIANVILFKITAVVQFLLITLEPVFKWIVDSFVTVIGWIKSFFEGFMVGLGDLTPELSSFSNSLSRIFGFLSKIASSGGVINNVFRTLGSIFSATLGPAIRGIVSGLDTLATTMEATGLAWQRFQAVRSGNLSLERELKKKSDKLWEDYGTRQKELTKRQSAAWKGAIADVKNTWSGDSVQNTSTSSSKVSSPTTNNVTVNVNGAQNPQAITGDVTKAIQASLKDQRHRGGKR